MIIYRSFLISILLSPALSGCISTIDPPLIFVQTTTVGITAATTGGEGTPELTVGYRDVDVAVVPVSASGQPIRSVTPNAAATGGQYQDALSVLGQFDVGVNAPNAPGAALGKFFATGTAASKLAEGYKCKLAGTACSPAVVATSK